MSEERGPNYDWKHEAENLSYQNKQLKKALKSFTETVDHRAAMASYPMTVVTRARQVLLEMEAYERTLRTND